MINKSSAALDGMLHHQIHLPPRSGSYDKKLDAQLPSHNALHDNHIEPQAQRSYQESLNERHDSPITTSEHQQAQSPPIDPTHQGTSQQARPPTEQDARVGPMVPYKVGPGDVQSRSGKLLCFAVQRVSRGTGQRVAPVGNGTPW